MSDNRILFSRVDDPEDFPDMKTIDVKYNWLARFICWVLKKCGFNAHYYDPKNMYPYQDK